MKCSKCEKEIKDDYKFCSNCGKHVEEKPELDIEGLAKICSKVGYILGFMKGAISGTIKDKKALEDFEELLKKNDGEMWEWYQEVIEYWDKQSTQNNEKDKKTNGSKRASLPKTQKPKAKEE